MFKSISVTIVLFSIFFFSSDACAQKKVPEPAKNPRVIKAKRDYENASLGVKDSLSQLSRDRTALSKLLRGGSASAASMSKPNELITLENELAALQQGLNELKDELLEEMSDEMLYELKAKVQDLNFQVKGERAKSITGETNQKLVRLMLALNEAESLLKRHEVGLLAKNAKYAAMLEDIEEKKKELMSEKRRWYVARSETSKLKSSNRPEVESQKAVIAKSLMMYNDARKRQKDTKESLELAIAKATEQYKKYLVRQEQQRQKNLQKRGRRSETGRAIRRATRTRRR